MPDRMLAARELADVFKTIAHPDRIRMIEELRAGELDVNSLVAQLDLPGPRVSQHLSLLRAHRIVDERRDGRHRYYSLTQPQLAGWITAGLAFVEGRLEAVSRVSINNARTLWSAEVSENTPGQPPRRETPAPS